MLLAGLLLVVLHGGGGERERGGGEGLLGFLLLFVLVSFLYY